MYPQLTAFLTLIDNSLSATLLTASSSDSPNCTVPPGKCHWPLQGLIERRVMYISPIALRTTISTVKRGTFE